MNYLVLRPEKVQTLHNIYSSNKGIPDFIRELIEVPEVARLEGVDQNAGISMSGFNTLNYKYSTLDHSLGVALILNNFITNKNQIIAALLHDLAVPAFSHSTKYIDEKNYNPKENKLTVYDAIIGSDILFDYFLKNGVSIEDMCDYTKYPLAYNFMPHLSAHRLEYFLHTMYMDNICTEEEIEQYYNNLVVVPNEDNMPEFCFLNAEIGRRFCLHSIECGMKYRSYESKATMKFISDTIAAMVRREVISRKDLYTYSDKVIMDMGLNCSDKRISDRWRYLPSLNKVYTKFNDVEGKHCYKLPAMLKYSNPLVKAENGEYIRVSKLYDTCREKINTFLNSDTDLYFYVEYED